jgi:putative ABC transport system permease protein
MFRNYLLIAIRNLRKDIGFSVINIFGLAIGLATCLLITLFVIDELSYDQYNENAQRIYRIEENVHINGNGFNSVTVPFPMGITLAKEYPQIEKIVRLQNDGDILVKKGNETIVEHNAVYADSTLFGVFTLPLIAGNPQTALTLSNSMVISESLAKKYFNSTNVVGRTLQTGNMTNYKITGVIKDMPVQSHFHFGFIKAMSELTKSRSDEWLSNDCVTYLLVPPGTDEKSIDHHISEIVRKYISPQLQAILHSSVDDIAKKNGDYVRYPTIALTKIHLHSNMHDEFEPGGNIQYVYIFIVIAIFILLVACVNFMNLSTARSSGRSKEVGVRKVLGSLRSNLVSQFLIESVLTSFIAMLLAVLIASLLLPYFNQLSGKKIELIPISKIWLIPSLLVFCIIIGLLAGIYPAFYLSSFQPIQVLKGKMASGFKSGWLRNSLVVFQFAVAILLIVGTLVIYSQLNYIHNKDLGYNREQVLTVQNTYSLGIHAKAFKDQVLRLPGIEAATMTKNLPNSKNYDLDGFSKDASLRANQMAIMEYWHIDADFIPTLGMEITKGRNFSSQYPTDSLCVLINETAVRLLGYNDPLNRTIYALGSNDTIAYRIIGVVKDFHEGSLHVKIGPMLFNLAEDRGAVTFRVHTNNIPGLIEQIKRKYHGIENFAGQPFVYSFMDDDFNRLYQSDQRTGKIFIYFAVFAIIIACLGLFGLITYSAEQRTKEIGIRKVLGATVSNILELLSKDFLKLVLIAIIIGFPIAWWGMSKWLENFAYRTNISWWVFATAGTLTIMITILTVSFRAIKSALANPVKSLRTE